MPIPIEAILFVFLICVAIAVTKLQDLFAATMLTGISSLLAAGLFTLMDAVDVAFTEAAVGAGISTVLILGTLALTGKEEYQRKKDPIHPFLVVLFTGSILVYGTMDMPMYGDPAAPIHHHVAPHYIAGADAENGEIGVPNIVTGVLGSYRGYDTFGETTVILAAGLGVMLLLGGRRGRRKEGSS